MPSKMWDSPMKGNKGYYEEWPGETSGPGTYNDNPNLSEKADGSFKMKFMEGDLQAEKHEIDSPISNTKPAQTPKSSGSKSAGDNAGAKWDTPFVKGKMGK